MSKKQKKISEFDYRDMQVEYAFQLFREGLTARQVQDKLNVPDSINIEAMGLAVFEATNFGTTR